MKLGSDPIDQFSIPISERSTRLTKVYSLKLREKAEKPGRALEIVWDSRVPIVKGFDNRYTYAVFFAGRGNIAGNHYHKNKQELFFPIVGRFKVILEDIKSKTREKVELKSTDHEVIFIPTEIAHTVIARADNAVLLVCATYPGVEGDEFSYDLV